MEGLIGLAASPQSLIMRVRVAIALLLLLVLLPCWRPSPSMCNVLRRLGVFLPKVS